MGGLAPTQLVFRLLLYSAFSLLSLKATRNSHQFAAVVGTVTAWNFGEWAALLASHRAGSAKKTTAAQVPSLAGPVLAAALVVMAFGLLISGRLYAWSGEKRTLALGEEPYWFPHAAIKSCGKPGMPERFLGFHNGNAALYTYNYGPERKVFADARLEVIGPELFTRYIALQRSIGSNEPGWEAELETMGNPVVLADHATNPQVGASILSNSHWRCVWFDAIAADFVHESYRSAIADSLVDFGARHFRPDSRFSEQTVRGKLALAEALLNYASSVGLENAKPSLRLQLTLLGVDSAQEVETLAPDLPEGWKLRGMLETLRESPPGDRPIPRYRMTFDPVFDLASVRASYHLRKLTELSNSDFGGRAQLMLDFGRRGMDEAALPLAEQLIGLGPINSLQVSIQKEVRDTLLLVRSRMGPEVSRSFRNQGELEELINQALKQGRARTAAELVEQGFPAETRPWAWTDRLATLWLHLGEPDRAREAIETTKIGDKPALRFARLAVCRLVKDELESAKKAYLEALEFDPKLFEAAYGLAVLEQDQGQAKAAHEAALRSEKLATTSSARSAARAIARLVEPYAK